MGTNAVTKCLRVAENLEKILAIELLTAAQAYEFRGPAKSSPIIEKLFEDYRKAERKLGQVKNLGELFKARADKWKFALATGLIPP